MHRDVRVAPPRSHKEKSTPPRIALIAVKPTTSATQPTATQDNSRKTCNDSSSDPTQDLDEAILDRVDEVVHLPTPGLPERARLIRQYFSSYLHHDPPADFLRAPAVLGSAAARAVRAPAVETTSPVGGRGSSAAGGWHFRKSSTSTTSNSNSNTGSRDIDDVDRNLDANGERQEFVESRREGGRPTAMAKAATAAAASTTQQHQPEAHLPADTTEDEKENPRTGGGGGVVRLSDGFRAKAAGLMAMLAVRSEGFYGRDMAHFFSAVQV